MVLASSDVGATVELVELGELLSASEPHAVTVINIAMPTTAAREIARNMKPLPAIRWGESVDTGLSHRAAAA
jgi:hypothetical protein